MNKTEVEIWTQRAIALVLVAAAIVAMHVDTVVEVVQKVGVGRIAGPQTLLVQNRKDAFARLIDQVANCLVVEVLNVLPSKVKNMRLSHL